MNFLLTEEGGYWDDPYGGPTNHGITQTAWDAHCAAYRQPVRSVTDLTPADLEFFYSDWWHSATCPILPTYLDWAHFDTSVNLGLHGAAVLLQTTLTVLGHPLRVDGVLGPASLAAVTLCNIQDLTHESLEARRAKYRTLATRRPDQARLLDGWLSRVDRLETLIASQPIP